MKTIMVPNFTGKAEVIKYILQDALNELNMHYAVEHYNAISSAYDEGYALGYDDGYSLGYDDGHSAV